MGPKKDNRHRRTRTEERNDPDQYAAAVGAGGGRPSRHPGDARLEARTPSTITDRRLLREEIDRTRERGYSQDDEEFMEGMIALAVPINDDQGRLLSTLFFHAPTQRLTLPDALAHLPRLRHAAGELSRLVIAGD